MSQSDFIITYLLAGILMFACGYLLGSMRAESRAETMRRWWFEREQRLKIWKE
jgi:hypothetical protein